MKPRFSISLFAFVIILAFATACGGGPAVTEAAPTPEPSVEAAPTSTPEPTPLPTTPAPLVILIAPDQADPAVRTAVEAQVSALASERGMRWQIRQRMSADEAAFEGDYFVVLPPQEDFNAIVAAAPDARFLAVGITEAEPAGNLILVRTTASSPDIEAFLGGYIGATITEDWRIGIITTQDDFEGVRFTAFENGMRFFCGLCRPQFAPFYEYPFLLSLPAGASDAEWRALADFMRDRFVGTVYVSPGAGTVDMFSTLADLGINIIGSTPPPAGLESSWVASLRSEPGAAYEAYIPQLLDGETDLDVSLPVQILDINSELLDLGRLRLAEKTRSDLIEGYILPGSLLP